jgi:hypothetical protein
VSSHTKPTSIEWYMGHLSTYSDPLLEKARKRIERSDDGKRIVRTNPDRRLYAVLKPTRAENLERIKYVLCAMDAFRLYGLLSSLRIAMIWQGSKE